MVILTKKFPQVNTETGKQKLIIQKIAHHYLLNLMQSQK